MFQDKIIRGSLVPATVIAAFAIGSAISQQRSNTQPSQVGLGHAESLSNAFRNAANEVLPTVVKIRARIESRRVRLRGREDMFRGTPFEEFFGDERFGVPFQEMPEREGTGSGVIIGRDGLILTNNHVVREADEVIVELADGREFTARDIRTDPKTDIAILRIDGAGTLPAARLGDSDRVQIGDWVLAIGNPFELEASVSAGIVSAKGRSIGSAERASFLQTDAAINPGNSGGPLVNLAGEIVGVNTAIASSSGGYQGIGFAIPINLTKWVTEQLVDKGAVSRAYLGVAVRELDQATADLVGVPQDTKGVVVVDVLDDTPAKKAGVMTEDVITHLGDKPILTGTDLQRAVEKTELGSRQKLRINRHGREMQLVVVTEALPDDVASRSPEESRTSPRVEDSSVGIAVAELDGNVIEQLELPRDLKGVIIVDVPRTTVAYRAGLRRGMVVTRINRRQINRVEDFEQAMADADLRAGIAMTVKIPGRGDRFIVLQDR